jgi:curved DNA-binding protein CbpA
MPPTAYFGTVAYELGHIDTATLDDSLLEISRTKRLHGEVLIDRGAISSTTRDLVLVEQTCRKVHQLFTLSDDTYFAFYSDNEFTAEPPFLLDVLRPAWRGLRDRPLHRAKGVQDVLDRYAGAPIKLVSVAALAHAGLDPAETQLCESLQWTPKTIQEVRAESRLPPERLDLLLYLLIIAKAAEPLATVISASPLRPPPPTRPSSARIPQVRSTPPPVATFAVKPTPTAPPARITLPPGSGLKSSPPPASSSSFPAVTRSLLPGSESRNSFSFRVPSAPPGRTPSSPPASSSPVFSPADLGAHGIEHRAGVVESEDPYTTLGLAEGASIDATRAAYFRLAKLWHPDKLPSELAPFRPEVGKVFTFMTRAHHTLTDPDARRDYLANRITQGKQSGAPEKRPRADVLRDIDLALHRRDFGVAEAAARQLAAVNPDDADAQALATWASLSAGEAGEEALRASIPQFDRAVNRDRESEYAFYFRGMVQKRLGNHAHAFRDFARVVQLNPKHVDAQREVRIFEMRARKNSGEHALDALLSRTKKK